MTKKVITNLEISGDIAVNGGDITTTSTSFNVGPTATTGTYTTTINPAATTGTQVVNINTNTAVTGTGTVNIGSTFQTGTIYMNGTVVSSGPLFRVDAPADFWQTITATAIVPSGNIVSSNRSGGAGVNTASNGYSIQSAGYGSFTRDAAVPLYLFKYNTSGTSSIAQFYISASTANGTTAGTINTSAGGTPAFASGSDYRMKENIVPVTDALERMKLAKAYTFNKIESVDPTRTTQTGFLAHELAGVHPDAVIGEKDAVDENGDPIYQEVMEAKIIPIMAQAISDLIAKVESLEARLGAN